jgi:hypothetical protein
MLGNIDVAAVGNLEELKIKGLDSTCDAITCLISAFDSAGLYVNSNVRIGLGINLGVVGPGPVNIPGVRYNSVGTFVVIGSRIFVIWPSRRASRKAITQDDFPLGRGGEEGLGGYDDFVA